MIIPHSSLNIFLIKLDGFSFDVGGSACTSILIDDALGADRDTLMFLLLSMVMKFYGS